MKVILVNGSPHEKGCTYTALKEIENTLNNQDIESEIFWLGNKPISGCLGCGSCTLGNVLRSMWERGWSFIKKKQPPEPAS